jgi:hypothetical protein
MIRPAEIAPEEQALAPQIPVDVEIVAAEDGRTLDIPYTLVQSGSSQLSLRLEPPSGLLAWDSREWWIPECRGIRRLRVVYPLRRETHLTGLVVGPRGERIQHFGQTTVAVAGIATGAEFVSGAEVEISPGAEGFRVRGVPWIPGLLVEGWSRARLGEKEMWAAGALRIGHDPSAEHILNIRADPAAEAPAPLPLGVGGGAGGAFVGRPGARGRGTEELGSVRILVLSRDGCPSPKCIVRITAGAMRESQTDDRGEALFERVPAGDLYASVRQPGFISVSALVHVEPRNESYVVLREPDGGGLRVLVIDSEGRSVAFARLDVGLPSGLPWIDINDAGVLRLDPCTDHLGRRELAGMEVGPIRIRASLGPLVGEAEAAVVDGRTSEIEVVVRDSRGP